MMGTKMVQTRAMDFTPPMMTRAVMAQRDRPMIHVGMPKVLYARSAMELACTVQPMPKLARAVKTANASASHFMPRPSSRAYMGPP